MAAGCEWRGEFDNAEVNALHGDAFKPQAPHPSETDWKRLAGLHSLGWVVAREAGVLVGFVNIVSDGGAHAWVEDTEDTMVATSARRQGIGTALIAEAALAARAAGCEWLHVDFDDQLRSFYFDSCGFIPTTAGLLPLQAETSAPTPQP